MKSYFFLHGFLGSGSDWQPVKTALHHFHQTSLLISPSFLKPNRPYDVESFESLINSLRHDKGFNESQTDRVFIGYSLGGRIGLNWLRLFPQDFKQWVFISTHPGLTSEAEKAEREKNDLAWADKLEDLGLHSFIEQWNAQPVFADTKTTEIFNFAEFDSEKFKSCFKGLSLSQQLDHHEVIRENQKRITWIVGDKDTKFHQMAEKLKKDKIIQDFILLSAGHRVHLDQPAQLAQMIAKLQ